MEEALEYEFWTTEEEVDPESLSFKEQVTFKEVTDNWEGADACLWEGECWGREWGGGEAFQKKETANSLKAQ